MSIFMQLDHVLLKYVPMGIWAKLHRICSHSGITFHWLNRLFLLGPIYKFAEKQDYSDYKNDFFKIHIRRLAKCCKSLGLYQELVAYVYGIVAYTDTPTCRIVNGIDYEVGGCGALDWDVKLDLQQVVDDIEKLNSEPVTEDFRKTLLGDAARWNPIVVVFLVDMLFDIMETSTKYIRDIAGEIDLVRANTEQLYDAWANLGTICNWR